MGLSIRHQEILNYISEREGSSVSQLRGAISSDVSLATLNRDLADLVSRAYLIKRGKGRATVYAISASYKLFSPFNTSTYFDKDPDSRGAQTTFDIGLLTTIGEVDLFSTEEQAELEALKARYQENISDYPSSLYQRELERLTIELSWKSSQIEGNTYSLLETEILFKEKKEAQGKPKEDAIMLLNHRDVMTYLLEHRDIAKQLSVRLLEDIHSLLIKVLGVSRNIRSRAVGITGTAYKPLDNIYHIKESLEALCAVINIKANYFEKAFLAICLISYLQPFEDRNERVGRMIGNALLLSDGICPLSYRNIDSLDYKKAMLLFYEQNNLSAFKKIFMEQIKFSVNNYFQ